MPIIFSVVGVVGILFLFNIIKLKDSKTKIKLIITCSIFEGGFFVGNLYVANIYFNFLHLIIFFILLSSVISYLTFSGLIVSLLLPFLFFLFLLILNYKYFNFLYFIFMVFSFRILLNLSTFFQAISNLLVSLLGYICVDVFYQINMISFAEINFIFVYNILLIFILIYFVIFCLRRCCLYEKITFYNFITCGCSDRLSYKYKYFCKNCRIA